MLRSLLVACAVLAGLIAARAAAAETPLERGTYLMHAIVACGNCHTVQTPDGPMPGMELAGGMKIEEPGLFTTYVPNITPDLETGIGRWSDDDIVRAIREGIRPDGRVIAPIMPVELYRGMADDDVRAIVAYLRSVPAVRNVVPASSFAFPLPESYGPPVGSVAAPSRDDPVLYGAYLAGPLGHCIECHTPMDGPRRDFAHRLGAGGFELHGPWGISVAANITPHRETGIGLWTDAEIRTAITTGTRPDGGLLAPPMAFSYYRNIAAADLDAIVAYLRSLPPVENALR